MKEPKTKIAYTNPKILDKSVKVVNKTKKTIKGVSEHIPNVDSKDANNYATEQTTELAGLTLEKGYRAVEDVTRKIVNKGYDKIKEHEDNKRSSNRQDYQDRGNYTSHDKAETFKPKTKEQSQEASTTRSNSSSYSAKSNDKSQTMVKDDYPKSKKQVIQKQSDYAKRNFIKYKHDKAVQTKEININQSIQSSNDAKTNLLKTRNKKFNPKNRAYFKVKKRTKRISKSVKQTKKTIKTAQRTVKQSAKTVKYTAKTASQLFIRAKQVARATYTTIKASIKATITMIKALVSATKALVAFIVAGGWVAVIIIVLLALIMLILQSPFGMFFNDGDDTTMSISDCVVQLESEYANKITEIIAEAGDVTEIRYSGDSDADTLKPYNMIDVLGVFAVKINLDEDNPMDLLVMNEQKYNILQDIFWNMNSIDYTIEQIVPDEPIPTPSPTPSSDPEATPEPTPEPEMALVISVTALSYQDGAENYHFGNKKMQILEELMSAEYYPYFMELCGMSSFVGLTPEQINNLVNDLPVGTKGAEIVSHAITRLGHPYSQPKRGMENYVDCSYLTRWAYQEAGVSHFTAGTAAEQTRYCIDNGLAISYADLQAGDLIFWSFKPNGRFMNVTHTGLYVGDGMIIDASFSRGMVVYRPIFSVSKIVACARPHVR